MGADRPRRARDERARYSQSLHRGLAILSCFTPQTPSLGVAEVAGTLDMSRATAHRYLQALAKLGYLQQDGSRRYRLDVGVTDLGLAAWNAMGLPQHAHPQMTRLARRTGRTVELAALDGCETVLVDRASPTAERSRPQAALGEALDRHLPADGETLGRGALGHRAPAHCTSAGKAILAFLPADALERWLARAELVAHASKSITDPHALAAELEHVRLESLASAEDELADGLFGIAAPIRGQDGEALGAIAIEGGASPGDSTPGDDDRRNDGRDGHGDNEDGGGADRLVERFGGLLIGTAELISRRLGWVDED